MNQEEGNTQIKKRMTSARRHSETRKYGMYVPQCVLIGIVYEELVGEHFDHSANEEVKRLDGAVRTLHQTCT